MDKTIREFHDLIDMFKIAKQLNRKAMTKVLTLLTVKFEIQKQAAISSILFKLIKNDKAHVKFIYTLA